MSDFVPFSGTAIQLVTTILKTIDAKIIRCTNDEIMNPNPNLKGSDEIMKGLYQLLLRLSAEAECLHACQGHQRTKDALLETLQEIQREINLWVSNNRNDFFKRYARNNLGIYKRRFKHLKDSLEECIADLDLDLIIKVINKRKNIIKPLTLTDLTLTPKKKNKKVYDDAVIKIFGGKSKLPGATLGSGYLIKTQPGDGSCLFHSMSYGLNDGTSGHSLRREICKYIESHPDEIIAGNPLKEWIKWDSNCDVRSYSRRMSDGAWGGGIEMAIFTKIKNVNLHVYERNMISCLKRISAFDQHEGAERKKIVRVIYQCGDHYDAVVISSHPDERICKERQKIQDLERIHEERLREQERIHEKRFKEMLQEQERLREDEMNSTKCCICFDEQANTILQPCGHARFCSRCIDAHFETILNSPNPYTCPICRVRAYRKEHFF